MIWDGQELFMYNGTLVFIVEYLEDNMVKVSYYPSGPNQLAEYKNLKSATPKELAEAGI